MLLLKVLVGRISSNKKVIFIGVFQCSIMAMSLLYGLTLWSNVSVWALDPIVS
jgi:hypothetical protein